MKRGTRFLAAAAALTLAVASRAKAAEEGIFRQATPTIQCDILTCWPTGWDCGSPNCNPLIGQLCCNVH